jgi:hypothetical protein
MTRSATTGFTVPGDVPDTVDRQWVADTIAGAIDPEAAER